MNWTRMLLATILSLLALSAACVLGWLLVPAFREGLESCLPLVLLALSLGLAFAAFISLRSGKLVAQLESLSEDIARGGLDSSGGGLATGAEELQPLVRSLNGLLQDIDAKEGSSHVTLLTNRVLARELLNVGRLADSLPDGIILTNALGNITLANEAARPFLKMGVPEAKGKPLLECLADPMSQDYLREALAGSGVTHPLELSAEGGSNFSEILVQHSCTLDEGDDVVGRLVSFRDISQAKRVERLQGEFMDSVAHELRTPLASILAYVELLIDGDAPDEQSQHDFYNIIYQEAFRLSSLIDNLLNMSMIESGVAKCKISPVRMKRLLTECTEVIRPQCHKRQIDLVATLPDRLPTLDIDKRLVSMAFMNVLGNAVKYTPVGGTVTLGHVATEDEILVTVHDTGHGIAEDEQERIFDKFYRCEAVEGDDEVSGSGVGLATAQQIMKMHGGEIRVSSRPEEGALFSLVFPRALVNKAIGD